MAFDYEKDFQADQWYPKADSLYKEQVFGLGGEIDPRFPNTQMFNFDTGDYSTEYLSAIKDAGINFSYQNLGQSPRDAHYAKLQNEAILGSWSGDQSYLAFPGEGLLDDIKRSYGNDPRFSKGGKLISPYKFHQFISGETSGIANIFDKKDAQNEMISTISGFTTDQPVDYNPFPESKYPNHPQYKTTTE